MKLSILLLLTLTITGCENKKSQAKADKAEDEFYNQSTGGDCGLDVVSDYNSMVSSCNFLKERSELYDCKSNLTQLIDKYPGIDCKAEKGYGLDKQDFYITEPDLKSLLKGMNKKLDSL